MENLFTQKSIDATSVFNNFFLDTKRLYLSCFNRLPCVSFIDDVNGEKAFRAFTEKYKWLIRNVYHNKLFARKRKQFEFDRTVVEMENEMIVEFDEGWCEILHRGNNEEKVKELAELFYRFKEKQRRQPLEINLIVQSRSGLELKAMEIKRTKLNLSLFYEDGFVETDQVIQSRLRQKKDKGIVLLHGLPGTGKTTYLRYLVGKIKKRVLFLSPSVAGNLMDPDFIELLIDNPNTVLIIEDAENIIMDRRLRSSSSVSNLLNISDGLLADFLNVQLICTFNSPLTAIDSALLRKGRLIARHEFGKLNVAKAQQLSDYLGFKKTITEPMTIAEIANPHEKDQPAPKTEVIGFRLSDSLMN